MYLFVFFEWKFPSLLLSREKVLVHGLPSLHSHIKKSQCYGMIRLLPPPWSFSSLLISPSICTYNFHSFFENPSLWSRFLSLFLHVLFISEWRRNMSFNTTNPNMLPTSDEINKRRTVQFYVHIWTYFCHYQWLRYLSKNGSSICHCVLLRGAGLLVSSWEGHIPGQY